MKWAILVIGVLAFLVAVVAAVGAMLPVKHSASRKARFRQSAPDLYSVIAGPPDWRSDIKASGPLRGLNGRKRWFEQDAHDGKIVYELVEDSPPERRVTRIADDKLPFGGSWIVEIVPVSGTESEVRVTENGEVYNVIFRFVSRFVMGYYGSIDRYLQDLGVRFQERPTFE